MDPFTKFHNDGCNIMQDKYVYFIGFDLTSGFFEVTNQQDFQ